MASKTDYFHANTVIIRIIFLIKETFSYFYLNLKPLVKFNVTHWDNLVFYFQRNTHKFSYVHRDHSEEIHFEIICLGYSIQKKNVISKDILLPYKIYIIDSVVSTRVLYIQDTDYH